MLARPEVHSWHQYTFAGSMTMVFASGIGLFPGQPPLRGKRRFERPRRGTDVKDAPLARETVEQLDDFAGWVKAKRVERVDCNS